MWKKKQRVEKILDREKKLLAKVDSLIYQNKNMKRQLTHLSVALGLAGKEFDNKLEYYKKVAKIITRPKSCSLTDELMYKVFLKSHEERPLFKPGQEVRVKQDLNDLFGTWREEPPFDEWKSGVWSYADSIRTDLCGEYVVIEEVSYMYVETKGESFSPFSYRVRTKDTRRVHMCEEWLTRKR